MTEHKEPGDAHDVPPPWLEAAAAVQCDLDHDVRLEARGLVVAEMADVRLHERLAVMHPQSPVTVVVRGGRRLTGLLRHVGSDFIVVGAATAAIVPLDAIVGIGRLPRVLHEERGNPVVAGMSWRSYLRDMLGEVLHVSATGMDVAGRLTWVGCDHLSVASCSSDDQVDAPLVEVTIPWSRVDVITVSID